jgi:phthalate 4,5-dioxygenase reductase subunit
MNVTSSEGRSEAQLALRVAQVSQVAREIFLFDLRSASGSLLPSFSAGAHLPLRVPNGELRKYSLCNDPVESHRYLVAVKREASGRGGSLSLTDETREGDVLEASVPRNTFELVTDQKPLTFIAGGIGITPIVSMISELRRRQELTFKLYYLTRSREDTAFLDELTAPGLHGKIALHHDHGDPNRFLDLWPVLERPDIGHVYACGPDSLLGTVRNFSAHWSPSRVHVETFTEASASRPGDRPLRVRLARSGGIVEVPAGETILSALRGHGLAVPSSCESGTCGTCRTMLLSGEADHRDLVLLPEERDNQIMVCVSRALSDELELDL